MATNQAESELTQPQEHIDLLREGRKLSDEQAVELVTAIRIINQFGKNMEFLKAQLIGDVDGRRKAIDQMSYLVDKLPGSVRDAVKHTIELVINTAVENAADRIVDLVQIKLDEAVVAIAHSVVKVFKQSSMPTIEAVPAPEAAVEPPAKKVDKKHPYPKRPKPTVPEEMVLLTFSGKQRSPISIVAEGQIRANSKVGGELSQTLYYTRIEFVTAGIRRDYHVGVSDFLTAHLKKVEAGKEQQKWATIWDSMEDMPPLPNGRSVLQEFYNRVLKKWPI